MKQLLKLVRPVLQCSRVNHVIQQYLKRTVYLTPCVKQDSGAAWGSKKDKHRRSSKLIAMADPEIEAVLAPFRMAVKEQVMANFKDALSGIDFILTYSISNGLPWISLLIILCYGQKYNMFKTQAGIYITYFFT